jgi:hypothetical protein
MVDYTAKIIVDGMTLIVMWNRSCHPDLTNVDTILTMDT